jgi:hypothetical protein
MTDPISFPSAAVEIAPPVPYARWWALTEACSGRSAPFSGVRWFVAPRSAMLLDGEQYSGYWFADGNRIVLESSALHSGEVVRHEMLHALMQIGSHPRVDFVDRCGGIVAFGDGLHIEPTAWLPRPGPTSPVLSPTDLPVSVALSPGQPTVGLPDSSWVTILVSVTNPSADAVWVRVRPFFPGQTASQTFGYELGAPGYGGSGFDDYSSDSLVAFGPHETKRRAFDEQLPTYRFTGWWVRGHFSTDSTAAAAFEVLP